MLCSLSISLEYSLVFMLGAHIGGTVLTGDAKSCVIVVSCVKAHGGTA